MRVAILGEDKPGFIKPMSLGLQRMLSRLNVESVFFDKGLAMLNHRPGGGVKTRAKNAVKQAVNRMGRKRFEVTAVVSEAEVVQFERQTGRVLI